MRMKFNEATYNRPDGDRVLDAPQVFINLEEQVDILRNENAYAKNDRNGITIFKSDRVTMVLVALHGGASLLPQEIDGLTKIQVIEGAVMFESAQGVKQLTANQIAVLHRNMPFNISSVAESVLLLTIFDE